MAACQITRQLFLDDSQGKTFSDVAGSQSVIFDAMLEFFSDETRQCRMEQAEVHHDRPPLAGVIRELESLKSFDTSLNTLPARKAQRLRQAVGVIVRMVMEQRGWRKTGRKGSLGIRDNQAQVVAAHNRGGLSFWFVRAERYELIGGMPYLSVRRRLRNYESAHAERAETN